MKSVVYFMIIIKFGGSVITHKAKTGIYNSNATHKLLVELRNYYDELDSNPKISKKPQRKSAKDTIEIKEEINYDLILVHGAGSFGHISARKYELDDGFKDNKQLIGLSEVHNDVRDLNLKFLH